MSGWVKLHRELLDWEWYDHIPTKTLFMHLLLKVNYEEKKWRGIIIPVGSLVTSIAHLAEETGLSVKQVRTALDNLKKTNEVASKTTNKYSIISVLKWSNDQEKDKQEANKRASREQTKGKQRATTKEYNKLINNNPPITVLQML